MNLYSYFLAKSKHEKLVLATIIKTRGSTPQVSGASALFSNKGLVAGTVGGGVLEGIVIDKAIEAVSTGISDLIEFEMDADITAEGGAICGGSATVLLDASPGNQINVFENLTNSIENNISGVLFTSIKRNALGELAIDRQWLRGNELNKGIKIKEEVLRQAINTYKPVLINESDDGVGDLYFLEPVNPLKKLLIIGAGHIGKALTHLSSLVGFEVTVIDERPEFTGKNQIPDAANIICGDISESIGKIDIDKNTYIVIVTQGHLNDAKALKHCIHSKAAYIGMIGSRRKIRLIKDEFLKNGWAIKQQLDNIYAPIGIDIKSESIQEIAISITAELIGISKTSTKQKKRGVAIVVLAAGESKRMGEPKMLLPYEEKTIIETVVGKALQSKADYVKVVTGSNGILIREKLNQFAVDVIVNKNYQSGMLSSVQSGISAIPGDAKAVMILLGDQPMIKTEVIDMLIENFNNNAERIVVPTYKGKRGHPILIDMSFSAEVEELNPEQGLRQLLIENSEEVLEVEVDTPSILKDIDTKQDYKLAIK